jgi:serine/threonine protein kinase
MTQRVGPYEIVSQIGRGGMAVVYLARQPALSRRVALKELAPFQVRDESLAQRFLREARVAGSLNHPNIVTVYDFLEQDGVPYIAMEYLEGGSLRPWVGRTSPAQTAGALEGLLAGLSHAESMGIVHRDIKPENLLVTAEGSIKIADFGIAKAYQQVATEEMLTPAGATVGTPTYMAPEQAMAQELGPWTDLYQAGVIAYELIAGQVPFSSDGEPVRVMMQHINEPVPPLPEGTDPALEGWVRGMLAKDPSERPRGASAAWDELEEIVVGLLGPLWRRDARLGEPDPTVEHPPPLTPARFSSWQDYVPAQRATQPPAEFATPAPPTPPESEAPPPAEPPDVQDPNFEPPPTVVPVPAEPSPPEPLTPEPPPTAAPAPAEPLTPEPPPTAAPAPAEPSPPPPTAEPPPPAELPADPPPAAPSRTSGRRRAIVPLGALGVLAAAIVALLLVRGGGDDPPATPTATATSTATATPTATATAPPGPFAVGDGPDGIAVGAGATWVAASRDGTLTRIDSQTGETTKVDVGANPDSVIVAHDEVWVSLTDDDAVARVSTGAEPRLLGTVPVGSRPEGLAASENAVWVANSGDGSVTQILGSTHRTQTVQGVGGEPVDVAVGAGAVWVADSARASVTRVDGGRRQVVGTVTGIGPNPRALAIIGRDVWVVTADDGRLWRIDGDANAVAVAGSLRIGGQPRDITTDGEHLWVTDRERDRVVEIDPAGPSVVSRETVDGGPLEVAVDDQAVWVSAFDSGEVARLPR